MSINATQRNKTGSDVPEVGLVRPEVTIFGVTEVVLSQFVPVLVHWVAKTAFVHLTNTKGSRFTNLIGVSVACDDSGSDRPTDYFCKIFSGIDHIRTALGMVPISEGVCLSSET